LVPKAGSTQVRRFEVASLSGPPRIDDEIEQWVLRMVKENADWGYDRIVGAMANLGYTLSDQTVGNILQRHGIPPAPSAG
jgi:transposase